MVARAPRRLARNGHNTPAITAPIPSTESTRQRIATSRSEIAITSWWFPFSIRRKPWTVPIRVKTQTVFWPATPGISLVAQRAKMEVKPMLLWLLLLILLIVAIGGGIVVSKFLFLVLLAVLVVALVAAFSGRRTI